MSLLSAELRMLEEIENVKGNNGSRNNVYRNNFLGAMQSALRAGYPVCVKLLGEQYFNQCALAYIERFPMRNNNLNAYGEKFPVFMQRLMAERSELEGLEYLAELCQFEWYTHSAYYAENGTEKYSMHAHYNIKAIWDAHQHREVKEMKLENGNFYYQFL